MFKTLQNAFKIKEIRQKLFFTFLMLVVVRLGCQIPIPGTDPSVVASLMGRFSSNDAYQLLTAFTGGSLEKFTIFSLSITPYITSSIVMQLLTIAIPRLEELQKDGETGRKKIQVITRYITVTLAIIEAAAMSIGFGNSGIFGNKSGFSFALAVIISVIAMTAGSSLLMWIGERITENGVGNGISVILVINIIARIPNDLINLYESKVKITATNGRSVGEACLAAVIILAVIVAIVAFVILLQGGQRKIAVQYSKKLQGRKMVGGQSSCIPLKVNTAGVIPVIFASSIMQFPIIISSLFGRTAGDGTFWGKVLGVLNSGTWFNPENFKYTLGYLVYAILVVLFAYFYTAITFNPIEVADNMKKQGGFVPGIRPGKPTEEYLTKILNYIVFIGAMGLLIVATIPLVFSGVFNAAVSFGGTSLIIVVGVVLDTMNKIESMMVVRNYKGFLSN
jgi:preprotein translocase subunit SecY